jgi:hypothetical protein
MTKDEARHMAANFAMPIRPFLAAFELEAITTMSQALERACDALRLRMIDDSATRLVAEKIIELTRWESETPTLWSLWS